jgi:hypothetical protein
MCLLQLAMIALEERRPDDVARRAATFADLTAKLGEGAEGPFSDALLQLSRAACADETGHVAAWPEVERAIAGMRDVDAKSWLAYVLNTAAELRLERGDRKAARALAGEALTAADSVVRPSERVVAHMTLARLDCDAGATAAARAHLAAVLPALADRYTVSRRARDRATAVAASLGVALP